MSEITDLHNPFRSWLCTLPLVYRWSNPSMPTSEKAGEPDFILMRGNHFLAIEFKTEKGKIKPEQKKRHAEYAKVGAKVHVIRKMEIAVEIVKAWMDQSPAEPIDAKNRRPASLTFAGHEWIPDERGGFKRK